MTKKNLIFNKCPVDYSERKKKATVYTNNPRHVHDCTYCSCIPLSFWKKNALITTFAQLSCYICKSKY